MVLSKSDIELLRLYLWCGSIPKSKLKGMFSPRDVDNLAAAKLIRAHGDSRTLQLTQGGYNLLKHAGGPIIERKELKHRGDLLRRRVRVASFTATAFRSGIDPFISSVDELSESNKVLLPGLQRGNSSNLWGSSSAAALLHLNDILYGVYLVYPKAGRIHPDGEIKTVSNCLAKVPAKDVRFIFAGETYDSVLKELEKDTGKAKNGAVPFGRVWAEDLIPIHLLSCDGTGAIQLQIMAEPGYRKKLSQAALKANYQPSPANAPAWDAIYQGLPFVMAADMDLRRIDAALDLAAAKGYPQIGLAFFKGQATAILKTRYQKTGKAKFFTFEEDTFHAAFGHPLQLHTPDRTQYLTAKGEVIDAPPIKVN